MTTFLSHLMSLNKMAFVVSRTRHRHLSKTVHSYRNEQQMQIGQLDLWNDRILAGTQVRLQARSKLTSDPSAQKACSKNNIPLVVQHYSLELYSGMWWQDQEHFLNTSFSVQNLEGATFNAFSKRPGGYKGVRRTVDWLDFSVEHLSKYTKHLASEKKETMVREGLVEILATYIRNVPGLELSLWSPELAVYSTIAILPVKASSNQFSNEITKLQLGATLASLWRIGIGRAVVVGISNSERKLTTEAFELLKGKLSIRSTEFAYAEYDNSTTADEKLVPRIAIKGLQHAMRKAQDTPDDVHVEEWLGPDPNRWKYVYFTEPDLVLQTRQSALEAISKVLSNGHLMVAHRLELLPHQRDFPTYSKIDRIIPDIGVFAAMHDVNPLEGDICCDQGQYYPSNRKNPKNFEKVRIDGGCFTIWPHCGFSGKEEKYTDPKVVLDMHNRLLGYPIFRIKDGLGVPLVAANQRVCIPQRGPATCTKRN